jgi:hypothetical protein
VLAIRADANEGIEGFRSLWLVEALLYQLGIPENGRERGPKLVAHVGHELILVLARDLKIFDSFGKLAGSRLDLFEQAGVFNRDYGLVRKGIDELDLTFGEQAHFGAPDYDRANGLARVDQRDAERCAITELECILVALGVFIRFGEEVCDLNCSAVDDGTPRNEPTSKWVKLSDRAAVAI